MLCPDGLTCQNTVGGYHGVMQTTTAFPGSGAIVDASINAISREQGLGQDAGELSSACDIRCWGIRLFVFVVLLDKVKFGIYTAADPPAQLWTVCSRLYRRRFLRYTLTFVCFMF